MLLEIFNWLARTAVREVLFPGHCLVCGNWLGGRELFVCNDCRESLAVLPGQDRACRFCGAPTLTAGETCYACADCEWPFDRVEYAFHYQEPLRTLIRKMKYQRLPRLGIVLGKLMHERLPIPDDTDAVFTWVPLSAKRRRWRGFNQAETLARTAAAAAHLPALSLLRRIRHTPPQAKSSREERLFNLAGAFRVANTNRKVLAGRTVYLVDDVLTSGATAAACAGALKEAGADTVIVRILARAG